MGETSVLSIQHIGEMEMEAQRAFCAENKRLLLERYGRPPKALVRAAAAALDGVTLTAPAEPGQVVLSDVCGTGASFITTRAI